MSSTQSSSLFNYKPLSSLHIDLTTIQHLANGSSKLSVLVGGVAAISAIINLKSGSAITYITYTAVSWLGCRTVSYLCTKPQGSLFDSKDDIQQGLKISETVKVDAFSLKVSEIRNAIGLAETDVVITPLKSQIERIEFVASKSILTQFLECVQAHKFENINYTISPVYEDTQNRAIPTPTPLPSSLDLKVSAFINLVVFTPKKCFDDVKAAICQNRGEQMRTNSPPTVTEEGVARWETMGVLKKPGAYEFCEKDESEAKITTEIHQADLLKTLCAVVKVHTYNEVGYDIYLSYSPYYNSKSGNQKTAKSEVIDRVSNYVRFLFSNGVNFKLSSNVKLIVHAPIALADNVRRIIGENEGGLIGNYAHCTFTIGELEIAKTPTPQTPPEIKVRIETVVSKTIFRTVTKALDEMQGKITYSLHPMFERIDTKTLRQKQNLWNVFKDFLKN